MMTENDALMEIVHLASAALVADQSEVKRQALADIYDAIAAIVPVEGKGREAEEQSGRACRPATAEVPQGFSKFLTIAPGVKLVRFHGDDMIKYVARRVGTSGNPNTLFEIHVDKFLNKATVFRNDVVLFEIQGVKTGRSNVETIAVSALHSLLGHQHKRNSRRRRALKRRRLGILTPEQELARTVAEQKEGL